MTGHGGLLSLQMQNYEYTWSNSADDGHTLLHFPEGAGTSRGLRILFLIEGKVKIRNSRYQLLLAGGLELGISVRREWVLHLQGLAGKVK